jgi:flavorubredoxin
MKALVVYDCETSTKCTEQVAKTIADGLKAKIGDVVCQPISDCKLSSLKDYDCIVIGSPTIYRQPTRAVTSLFEQLQQMKLLGMMNPGGKASAAFGTLSPNWSWQGGNSAQVIEAKMKELNLNVMVPAFAAKVNLKGDYDYSLAEGEIAKAQTFASDLANALAGKPSAAK